MMKIEGIVERDLKREREKENVIVGEQKLEKSR